MNKNYRRSDNIDKACLLCLHFTPNQELRGDCNIQPQEIDCHCTCDSNVPMVFEKRNTEHIKARFLWAGIQDDRVSIAEVGDLIPLEGEVLPPRVYHSNVKLVPVYNIMIDRKRARKKFDKKKMAELVKSIREKGLFHPLLVTEGKDGKVVLQAGERRLRACMILNEERIPCSIMSEKISLLRQLEIELDENGVRDDLEWSETNELLAAIDEEKKKEIRGWGSKDTARLAKVSPGQASKRITFAKAMRERPELLEKYKQLPFSVALRQHKKDLDREKTERRIEKGELKPSASILQGDCRDLVKDLKDESVHCVITDPPFGLVGLEKETSSSRESYTALIEGDDNSDLESVCKMMEVFTPELFRVVKKGCYIWFFCSPQLFWPLGQILERHGFEVGGKPVVWFKGKGTSPFSGYTPTSSYELILYGRKPPKERQLFHPCIDVMSFKPILSEDKVHVFQKPPELLAELIELSTNKGETVLDPFCGSGQTVVSAKGLGRKGIGFEKNERHFVDAQLMLYNFEIKEKKEPNDVGKGDTEGAKVSSG